jgi:DNA (cytosine-5)-methyltransferase 1
VRYLSVCSGIEAATVAWHPLGWTPAAFSEIEPFPRAVLAHHFPDVPLHGDFTTIGTDDYGAIDLLVGGTPCQSFSIAGLRGGMADERGNLALEFLRLADRKRPRWLVWENVPGVLSSNGGRDFGSILGGMVELGYGVAYRILDAQFFGVPQRRRRVFVVGYFGDARRACAVLFERASLSGNPTPRRQAGAIASALTRDGLRGGGPDDNHAQGNHLVAFDTTQITSAQNRNNPKPGDPCHPLAAGAHAPAIAFGAQVESPFLENVALPVTARNGDPGMVAYQCQGNNVGEAGTLRGGNGGLTGGIPFIAFSCKDHGADAGDTSPTLRAMNHDGSHANAGGQVAVAFTASEQANSYAWESPVYPTLNAQVPNDTSNIQYGIRLGSAVRRLTPRECERLQGFPDDFTLVPYRGKPASDGPRYRALGNSMAVPCMAWIGERIEMVEQL